MRKHNLPSIAFAFSFLVVCTQASLIEQPNNREEETEFATSSSHTSSSYRQTIFPITSAVEIWGSILLMFAAALCNTGGLAGRPILLAVLIMIFNYSATYAIQVVYSLVFGASLGNFINVVGRRDPITKKPLIEYNLALICMPTMLLGATFGIILNRMACRLLTILGIMTVALVGLNNLVRGARKIYIEENKLPEEGSTIHPSLSPEMAYLTYPMNKSTGGDVVDLRLSLYYNEERQIFPIKKVGMLLLSIGLMIVIALSRGTQMFESIIGVAYCSAVYWGVVCSTILACLIMFFLNRKMLMPSLELKKMHNITSTQSRFELAEEHLRTMPILSLMGGIFSGFFGIGGGMSPALMDVGVPPRSIGPTAGFLILQTSFVSLFQSFLYEEISLRDQGFFFLISVVGSFGVSALLRWLVKKFKRPSLLTYTRVIVLILMLITIPMYAVITDIDDLGQLLQFNAPCS